MIKKIFFLLIVIASATKQTKAQCSVTIGGGFAVVCEGSQVILSASGCTSYTWMPSGANTASIAVTPSATTVYTVTGSTGTCTAMNTVTVVVNQRPTLNVSGATVDSASCGQSNGGITGISITGGTPSYSYQWYNSMGNPIPGGTSLTLSNVTGGTYILQVVDANGCFAISVGGVATFNVPSPNCAGISQYSNLNTNISIYPNPANTIMNVELKMQNEIQGSSIQIIDMLGNTVKQFLIHNSEFSINVADLNEGIYIIRISGNEGVVNKRLIIAR